MVCQYQARCQGEITMVFGQKTQEHSILFSANPWEKYMNRRKCLVDEKLITIGRFDFIPQRGILTLRWSGLRGEFLSGGLCFVSIAVNKLPQTYWLKKAYFFFSFLKFLFYYWSIVDWHYCVMSAVQHVIQPQIYIYPSLLRLPHLSPL